MCEYADRGQDGHAYINAGLQYLDILIAYKIFPVAAQSHF